MQAYAVYPTPVRRETHRARQHARAAGILYLITHVTSVTAVVAYASGHLAGGVTLEFALAIGCVGTGVLLWSLLRAYGPARAATFAALRAVEGAVIIAGSLPMLATFWLAGSAGQFAQAASAVHTASFLLGQGLVISVNTIVLAWLLWDSRAVGILDLAAGDAAAAASVLDRAVRDADSAGGELEIATRHNHARALAAQGQHVAALGAAHAALAIAERHGDLHRVAAIRSGIADLLHAAGRDDEAMVELKLAAVAFAAVDGAGTNPEVWTLTEW